jgi:hypothetical protein
VLQSLPTPNEKCQPVQTFAVSCKSGAQLYCLSTHVEGSGLGFQTELIQVLDVRDERRVEVWQHGVLDVVLFAHLTARPASAHVHHVQMLFAHLLYDRSYGWVVILGNSWEEMVCHLRHRHVKFGQEACIL